MFVLMLLLDDKDHDVDICRDRQSKADIVDDQLIALDKRVEYRMIGHRKNKRREQSAVAQLFLLSHERDADAHQSGTDTVHKSRRKSSDQCP